MRITATLLLCCIVQFSDAQDKNPFAKFGKITAAQLQKKIYSLDSNANAVVLSDIGDAAVEGNSKGWFAISITRHRVVHILNKSGYSEADVEVPLFTNGDEEEQLESVKAITYNLEGGKIVETKLDKSGIFKEKVDQFRVVKKFTFPNVKEGCIVEYEYKVTSDFIWNLDPWYFQGISPVLWSEFNLRVPQFFTYDFLGRGYLALDVKEKKESQDNFIVSDTRSAGATERISFPSAVTDYKWGMKNVPALKLESYSSAIRNHIAGMEFQLRSQNHPLQYHDYRSTWGGLTKNLLESEYFGGALKKDNNWLGEDLSAVLAGARTDMEKAKKVYSFLRDNFTCISHSGRGMNQNLKNVMKAKKGNVAEINILLTAMLRYAGLQASPVMLSTTDHGYALEIYPMVTSFNYVVSKVMIDGKNYMLDASHPRLGFGKLVPKCFNGHARVIDESATKLDLAADSLKERKVTIVFIGNDQKGNWVGNVKKTPGYYESLHLREKFKEKGKQAIFGEIEKSYGFDVKLTETEVDSLENFDEPMTLRYNIELKPEKEDILYVNPLFIEGLKTNPFKSAERYYPVEMPYTRDEMYLMTMEVPAGYEVDELPKQMIAKMDEEGSALFEYRISQSGSIISLRAILKISRTLFLPEEYDILREFFNMLVTKQNEQIVFKKKK